MKINIDFTSKFVKKEEVEKLREKANSENTKLHNKQGKGNDFLGWVDLPVNIEQNLLEDIQKTAIEIAKDIDVMVVIGIGGSYLGAKAVLEALSDNFACLRNDKKFPKIIFAGQNLSQDYYYELREFLEDKKYAITVISKSGTTTEPAVAFRILKKDLEDKYGLEIARKRIIAITDKSRGALKKLADNNGYKCYEIADDIGGRYSVLSPVGLFPVAVAGFDIKKLIEGAKNMYHRTDATKKNNIAEEYAIIRNLLYNKGFTTEILVNYNPKLSFFAEWWKQLYGESEGKEQKGIFPASVNFTTDLHSMGQYIQDGKRNLFETVLSVAEPNHWLTLPANEDDLDGLNYLEGKSIEYINKNAELGTTIAHISGGVPNLKIEIPKLDEFHLGELIYFFEKACGISGYLLDVNPFDQPGVEDYKRNMFILLEKPGFEGLKEKLLS